MKAEELNKPSDVIWDKERLQWGLGMKAEELRWCVTSRRIGARLQWGLGMKAEELWRGFGFHNGRRLCFNGASA